MSASIVIQLELLLRLFVAGVCGYAIGYERKNRLKEAGVRTHMIVALGAALIMIVSKYGFSDVLLFNGYVLDPSRIAAQVVSGIGFLGAGMIFVRKQAINGLTTAAGVWTTAGVGMAVGANLYVVGIATTVLVLLVQIIMHKNLRWLYFPTAEQINIEFSESAEAVSFVRNIFTVHHIQIINIKAEKKADGFLDMELFVRIPQGFDIASLMDLFKDNPYVRSVEY